MNFQNIQTTKIRLRYSLNGNRRAKMFACSNTYARQKYKNFFEQYVLIKMGISGSSNHHIRRQLF